MPGFSLVLVAAMLGCAGVGPQQRRDHAEALAATHHWQALRLSTPRFVLAAYQPITRMPSDSLAIYIEGDGLAWLSRSQPSGDPTPLNPIALGMAVQHGTGAAAYLARPCQYVDGQDARGCATAYWTERRFAPEVIEATSLAIDQLKQAAGARQLVLVGYSGGGAVAALVAARRKDVRQLVTVAGNLDHLTWTRLHQVPALTGSLNPADDWVALQTLDQLHWVGQKDSNVSIEVAKAYQARFPPDRQPVVRELPDIDHSCCWVELWPELALQIRR